MTADPSAGDIHSDSGLADVRSTERGAEGAGWERDRGAASILVLAIGLVLVAAGFAGAGLGVARIDRHRAQIAADLGALAGAAQVINGPEEACAAATRFVAANDGRMTGCEVTGLELVVHVDVMSRPLPGITGSAHASARAGPVYSTTI